MKCNKGFKLKNGKCTRNRNRSSKSVGNKLGFFKRNWDLTILYSVLVVVVIMSLIALSCSGYDCYGIYGVIMIALYLIWFSYIFLIIAIVRTIRNKELSKKRWIFMIIWFVILLIILQGRIQYLNPLLIFMPSV